VHTTAQVFLLSPAHCGGKRAAMLTRPGAAFPLATSLRAGAASLGEVFAFMSGLYFRGKLAYGGHYGRSPEGPSSFVITPTRGLLTPDTPASIDLIREFASVDVHESDDRYRSPLERDLSALDAQLPDDAQIILLGSIATSKYVAPLARVVGHRLRYPEAFVGRGDMSRGGLMLRAVRSGAELTYQRLDPAGSRRGARPPRLAPL
jgi:hypothetical protein